MRKRERRALKAQEEQHQYELARNKMFDYVKEAGKPSSVAQLQALDEGINTTPHFLNSRFLGSQVMLLPQEDLPQNNGNMMTPILQVNLTEVPYAPPLLNGKAWLSVFMDLESMLLGAHPNGDNWLLRTYDSLEGLEIRTIPPIHIQEKAKNWQPAQVTWTLENDVLDAKSAEHEVLPEKWRNYQDDIPFNITQNKPRRWFDESTQQYMQAHNRFEGDNMYHWHIAATKLGGFPTYHQSDEYPDIPSHPRKFLLQIINGINHQTVGHPKDKKRFDLCDCSTTYIGWIDGEWWMETQTS